MNDYIRKFGASLNSAMALSLPMKHKQGQSPQYVAFIVICKGVPFYGYHVGYRTFLKIYMVHPTHKSRLSQCLRSGAVLGTEFDVFEDHIPFLLQFMLDSNLYGCGWVEVGECLLREGVPGEFPLFSPSPLILEGDVADLFVSIQNTLLRKKVKLFSLLLQLAKVLTPTEPTSISPFLPHAFILLKDRRRFPTQLSNSIFLLQPFSIEKAILLAKFITTLSRSCTRNWWRKGNSSEASKSCGMTNGGGELGEENLVLTIFEMTLLEISTSRILKIQFGRLNQS